MNLQKIISVSVLSLVLTFSACTASITNSHELLFFAKDEQVYLYDLEDQKVVRSKAFESSEYLYEVKYNPETEEIFYLTSFSWEADDGLGEADCTDPLYCYAKIYKSTWDSDPVTLFSIIGRIHEWSVNTEDGGVLMVMSTPADGRQFTRLDANGTTIFSNTYQIEEPRSFSPLLSFQDHSYQVSGAAFFDLYLSILNNEDGTIEVEKIYETKGLVDTTITSVPPDESGLHFYAVTEKAGGYGLSSFFYDFQQKSLEEINLHDFAGGQEVWSGEGRKFTIRSEDKLTYYDLDEQAIHTIIEEAYEALAWRPLTDKMLLLTEEPDYEARALVIYNFATETIESLPEEFQIYNLIDIQGLELFAASR